MLVYYLFNCFGQMLGNSVCDVVVFHSCGLDSFRYGLMRGGVRFSQRQLFTPVTQSNLLSLLVLLHFYVFYRSLVTGATYLKKSVSCLNTYVWHHIPTLTMLYDQAPTENRFLSFLLVRPPRSQSLLIMGWCSSIPEHRLWIPLDSGPIV